MGKLAPAMDEVLATRVDEWHPDLLAATTGLYGEGGASVAGEVVECALAASQRRDDQLKRLDDRRLQQPDWFQRNDRVGYFADVERFGPGLAEVQSRLPYLAELGVNVLHLATTKDYDQTELAALANAMRAVDMSLCVDLTVDPVDSEPQWGDPERILATVDRLCLLANFGVEIIRLHQLATAGNEPESHLGIQVFRAALGITAPATILLAPPTNGPHGPTSSVSYLGKHTVLRRECELAYHPQLMVQGWSMLATQRANLARVTLSRVDAAPTGTSWATYVRNGDEVAWAVDDTDAAACGVTGSGHRTFLADFYRGDFWQSFARGTPLEPGMASSGASNDQRTCGMTASLAGIAAALADDDPVALDTGVRRVALLYALIFGYGGLPFIHMGDEFAHADNIDYLYQPGLSADARFAQRPDFDDEQADLRATRATYEQRVFTAMRGLIQARRGCLPLHAAAPSTPIDVGHATVFAWQRDHPVHGPMIGLANVGATEAIIDESKAARPLQSGHTVDHLAECFRELHGDTTTASTDSPSLNVLAPYQVRWIAAPGVALATVPAATSTNGGR